MLIDNLSLTIFYEVTSRTVCNCQLTQLHTQKINCYRNY